MSLEKLHNVILSSQATEIKTNLHAGRLATSSSGSSNIILLPPNRSIILNTLPKAPRRLAAPKKGVKRDTLLPKEFTWIGNKLIQKASNQHTCGSCWAFATSGMFSDIVAIATNGKLTPKLSPTYLLSCKQQFGCGGGYPTEAIKTITDYGIVYSDCVDYSWCERNSVCAGNALKHFENPTEYLNSRIPTCYDCKTPTDYALGSEVNPVNEKDLPNCKSEDIANDHVRCLQGGGTVNKYFGKNPYAIFAETDSSGNVIGTQLEDVIYDMKEHLVHRGPIVGSYMVLSNFLKEGRGIFEETNGVYIDSFSYKDPNGQPVQSDNDGVDTNNKTPFKTMGGHAVVIVGYGEMQVDAVNPSTGLAYGKIGYWDVRNSWGDQWGNAGFFKIANYPVNKYSQFDVGLKVGNGLWMGGTSLVEFDRVEKVKVVDNKIVYEVDENDDKNYPYPTSRSEEGEYNDDDDDDSGSGSVVSSPTLDIDYKLWIKRVAIALIILIALYAIYSLIPSGKRSRRDKTKSRKDRNRRKKRVKT